MKHILFFMLIGVFFWVALVPPEGMNKYPSVDVEFQYSKGGPVTQVKIDTGSQPSASEKE